MTTETVADYQLKLVRKFLETQDSDFLGSSEVRVLRLMLGLPAKREIVPAATDGQLREIDGGRDDSDPAA